MTVLALPESNTEIRKLILQCNPFSIVRLGLGDETHMSLYFLLFGKFNLGSYLTQQSNMNGIYSRTNDVTKFEEFCENYMEAVMNSDLMASFTFDAVNRGRNIKGIQNFLAERGNLKQIHSRSVEPFYTILSNPEEKPWTHALKGKRVLIINPFVASFKKQMGNNFQMFTSGHKLFLDDQEFVWYKSHQTIAGNHIHEDWVETYKIMCEDIRNLEFDIALLGCGGYGLPLCNFIKTELGKSAIYVGGGLQLLFGVMGHRWENRPEMKEIIAASDGGCKFIRPSIEEMPPGAKTIENGCYW